MGNIKRASALDLSNQGLTTIPDFIFQCRNLKKLNLSNNKIKVIPLELTKLKFLKILDISGNQIHQLYSKTFDLPNLRILNLNNNQIRSLPKQIANSSQLRELHISGNLLDTLPAEISGLTELVKVNLSGNHFSIFPRELLSMQMLEKLWIGENLFDYLPVREMIESFPSLKALYCFSQGIAAKATDTSSALLLKQKGNVINDLKLMSYSPEKEQNSHKTLNESAVLSKKIFISFSHKDIEFHTEVETSIRGLQHTFPELDIDSWSDQRLNTGDTWREEIQSALEGAGIAILITSRHFIASDFIMKSEVPIILKNAKSKGTKILNLIAGKCIAHPELKEYQYLNSPDRPLNSLNPHEQDLVYTKLQEDLKALLEK